MKTIKSRLLLVGTLLALVIIGTIAKAEDKAQTVTPKLFVDSVVAVPGKVSEHIKAEWVEIKAFQAASWVDAKAQNKANWEWLKSIFNTTKTTN